MSISSTKVLSTDEYNPSVDNWRYRDEKPKLYFRYLNAITSFRHHYPKLSLFLDYAIPLVCVATLAFVFAFLPGFGLLAPGILLLVQSLSSIFAGLLLLASGVNQFIAQHVLGDSVDSDSSIYQQERSFVKGRAYGKLELKAGALPKLSIRTYKSSEEDYSEYYDSGFVEGYIQGPQMKKVIGNLDFLYCLGKPLMGAPQQDKDLKPYLEQIEKTIPQEYLEEMKGKVNGYNQWLKEQGESPIEPTRAFFLIACIASIVLVWVFCPGLFALTPTLMLAVQLAVSILAGFQSLLLMASYLFPDNKPLDFYKYLLLQLLPDVHFFNPFKAKANVDLPSPGCTSIGLKVKDYTLYVRVLDWPAYGVAGQAFIQIERYMNGQLKSSDASLAALTGAITSVNSHHLLTQINVSRGTQGGAGMPGVFMIRYLNEKFKSVDELLKYFQSEEWDREAPLAPMHISATDGSRTISMHAHQGSEGGHVVEELGQRPMVVANFGWDATHGELISHVNSSSRLKVVNDYLDSKVVADKLAQVEGNSPRNLDILKEIAHQLMQLPFVNNFESVYSGVMIYKGGQLIESCAATAHAFSGSRQPCEFKNLAIPTRHR